MFKFLNNLFFKNQVSTTTFSNIVAAKVLEIFAHPNADRLRIVKLDIGKTIISPVVCGAQNFTLGDIVALALPGAVIVQGMKQKEKEPFVLNKATIRGVESQGMICAAFELGLSDSPEQGIMLLKKETVIGSNFRITMTEK